MKTREDSLAWFRDARFGLFLHYGLYSLIGKGEWHQHHARIAPADYAAWKEKFTAERFDADAIADLAVAAGMTYVTLTTRHHDGFCLFATDTTDFHSVNSPARRDLVGEMAEACRRRGLGFFLYYSYGLDWRHPDYDVASPEKMTRYVAFMRAQLRELLTRYGPVAGVWFDPVGATYARPEVFAVEETYRLIRELQPQALIGYKQGSTGTEDFVSCEGHIGSLADFPPVRSLGPAAVARAAAAWAANAGKPIEVCTTLQADSWGYHADARARLSADDVRRLLAGCAHDRANLLLNSGPLPDGSIHPDEIVTLRATGERLAREGWPAPLARTDPAPADNIVVDGAQAR